MNRNLIKNAVGLFAVLMCAAVILSLYVIAITEMRANAANIEYQAGPVNASGGWTIHWEDLGSHHAQSFYPDGHDWKVVNYSSDEVSGGFSATKTLMLIDRSSSTWPSDGTTSSVVVKQVCFSGIGSADVGSAIVDFSVISAISGSTATLRSFYSSTAKTHTYDLNIPQRCWSHPLGLALTLTGSTPDNFYDPTAKSVAKTAVYLTSGSTVTPQAGDVVVTVTEVGTIVDLIDFSAIYRKQ